MPLRSTLDRRVRPRTEPAEDNSHESGPETQQADGLPDSSGEEDGSESDVGDEEAGEDDNAQQQLSNISFGTLAKAQDSLSRKRKRGSDAAPQQEDKLDALRARLQELREAKGLSDKHGKRENKAGDGHESAKHRKDSGSENDKDDDDSSEESEDEHPAARSSKHAPMSQPSNRQVTRRRIVIDVPKRHSRDPRFGPVSGVVDDARLERNYSFLNDYQATEMAELKAAIRKTKDEDDKEVLKRTLMSMENRKKAREAKERQQEVVREHRRKEKDAIKDGKQPFYLKRSEQKQLAIVEKFNSMKGKDRENLMERRRKKAAGKEKKNMPRARRVVG